MGFLKKKGFPGIFEDSSGKAKNKRKSKNFRRRGKNRTGRPLGLFGREWGQLANPGGTGKKDGLAAGNGQPKLKKPRKKRARGKFTFFSISNEKQKDRKTLQSPRRKKMARK